MKPAEEGGFAALAEIQPDGTYATHTLTTGTMVVTISVPSTSVGKVPKGGHIPPGFERKGPFIAIAAKYASAKTSGLTFEVKPGKQTKDWVLD